MKLLYMFEYPITALRSRTAKINPDFAFGLVKHFLYLLAALYQKRSFCNFFLVNLQKWILKTENTGSGLLRK